MATASAEDECEALMTDDDDDGEGRGLRDWVAAESDLLKEATGRQVECTTTLARSLKKRSERRAAAAQQEAAALRNALAQQPVQPLPKVGSCPLGYYSSGGYCVPSSGGNSRGAIEKREAGCPPGFYSSGSYCVSSPSDDREAIHKTGLDYPARSATATQAL